MTGSDSSSQSSRYTHNDAAFVEYNTRFQSSNLSTFVVAASKFTEWLGSDKAYYPNARIPVRPRPQLPYALVITKSHLDRLHYRGMTIKRSFSSF